MSKFLSQREMFLVLQCILLSTSCLFCIANFPIKDETSIGSTSLFFFWLYVCFNTFLRIYVKTLQAEKITAAEKDLVTAIALLKWKHTDLAMLHEIKFLHDLMVADPIRIKFGNYLTYNQRVVLTIVGQVVTYLIVLMQFAQK
ncbi:unnamed protein product [Allacma fusca]|uniref:Uncharacterized protein n=1 Tax=Allacma fusca TaxID=39272 RepID=A0A8J2KP67_9HEXA|nr:unnamed protein product [Allacma fusca]